MPSEKDWTEITEAAQYDFVVDNARLYIATLEDGKLRVNEFTNGRDNPDRKVELDSDDICN